MIKISSRNLLDKAISVDEDSLDTPLEPLKFEVHNSQQSTNVNLTEDQMLSYQDITSLETFVAKELCNINTLTEDARENDITNSNTNNLDITDTQNTTDKVIPSILRRQSCYDQQEPLYDCSILPITIRKVSFPCDESLATYREPEFPKHWDISKF